MFKGKVINSDKWVEGYYFKTPLTDENSGVEVKDGCFFLSDGINRDCISTEHGVVWVVDGETVELILPERMTKESDSCCTIQTAETPSYYKPAVTHISGMDNKTFSNTGKL